MVSRAVGLIGLLAAVTAMMAGCETTRRADTPTKGRAPVRETVQFQPARYVSRLYLSDGAYPELYDPATFAVWVDQNVATLKREEAATDGDDIAPDFEAAAERINEHYVVIECHLASTFSDMSIAYDAVGLRQITAFLRTSSGKRVFPIQTVIDTEAQEEQVGALKRFSRTNLLVFPRRDLWLETTLIDPDTNTVQLVLQGYNCEFYFEWPGGPWPSPEGLAKWKPQGQEAVQATKLGFRRLYGRLMALAHIFD